MRTPPNRRNESDVKDLLKLKAAKWQIDLLSKNPEYVFWGNYEDYMSDRDVRYSEIMRYVSKLLKDDKVDSVEKLKGKPIEATFEGNTLREWRILTEVL
jgi:hypothetical protein